MRLFLAIEVPEEVRLHLDRVVGALKKSPDVAQSVSWVKRENWHITLKFLGEVADERVGEVAEALGAVPVEAMKLFADRMLYFPQRGPVRVIGVGIGGDAQRLSHLHESVEDALQPLGFERERRDYAGHITFGRSRQRERGTGVGTLRNITLDNLFPGPEFNRDSFVLMHSKLSPQGSIYTPVARFPNGSRKNF